MTSIAYWKCSVSRPICPLMSAGCNEFTFCNDECQWFDEEPDHWPEEVCWQPCGLLNAINSHPSDTTDIEVNHLKDKLEELLGGILDQMVRIAERMP